MDTSKLFPSAFISTTSCISPAESAAIPQSAFLRDRLIPRTSSRVIFAKRPSGYCTKYWQWKCTLHTVGRKQINLSLISAVLIGNIPPWLRHADNTPHNMSVRERDLRADVYVNLWVEKYAVILFSAFEIFLIQKASSFASFPSTHPLPLSLPCTNHS